MTDTPRASTVNTVLGPVAAEKLGVVAVHEALLSVVPGAEHAYDVSMDRAEIFETLAAKLKAFHAAGGRTIVDSTGMFHGRDVRLYEALSRATGVHIVATTGMGPEDNLGGYFLTPQTNPPTPWPADKFADLFIKEVTEGMVVPRVERRAPAGMVVTAANVNGMTPTEKSLFQGAAKTAAATGVPVSIQYGHSAVEDLDVVLGEGLAADRVVVGGMDRTDAVSAGAVNAVAERGAYVALDHVGLNDSDDYVTDRERVTLLLSLINAGHVGRILLSSSAIGVAKGQASYHLPYSYVTETFIPLAASLGLSDDDAQRIQIENPRGLLTVR